MKRQMIAAITATALVLSGFVAEPASAKNKNDVLKLLLGAAAVGLLLQQLNGAQARPAGVPAPTRRSNRNDNDWNDDGYMSQARTIPAECLIEVESNGRLREVVSARCLTAFGVAERIPDNCAFDIRTSAGRRTVYGPQCLRDYGYRVEAARY